MRYFVLQCVGSFIPLTLRLLYGRSARKRAWIISLPLSPCSCRLLLALAVVVERTLPFPVVVIVANCPPISDVGGSDVIDWDCCFIVMAHCEFPTLVNSLFREAVEEDAWNSLGTPSTSAATEVVTLDGGGIANWRWISSSFITGIIVSPPWFWCFFLRVQRTHRV